MGCVSFGTFDVKMPLEHNLHLVIRIRVVQRRAFFQAVEAAGDGGGGGRWLALGMYQHLHKKPTYGVLFERLEYGVW